jgi:methyl-accepting chemotaxis protein
MFQNLKIGTRLGLGYAVLIVLMLGMTATTVVQLRNIDSLATDVVAVKWPKTVVAGRIIANVNANTKAVLTLMYMTDLEQMKKTVAEMAEASKELTAFYEHLDKTVKSESGKELLAKIKQARAAYINSRKQAVDLALASQPEKARTILMYETMPFQKQYIASIDALIAHEGQQMEASGKAITSIIAESTTISIAVGLAMLLLAAGSGFWLTRSITRPLKQAVDAANQLAEGNLSLNTGQAARDETGQLLSAMQSMVQELTHVITQVRSARRPPSRRRAWRRPAPRSSR